MTDIINRQTQRIDEIASQMKAYFKVFTDAQKRLAVVKKHIERVHKMLRLICSDIDKPTAETLKLCNKVNWDGTRTDLPPLGPVKILFLPHRTTRSTIK